MFRIISRRAYNTLKSKNDEQNNLKLLQMLKKIPALGERIVKEKVEKEQYEHLREIVSFDKIDKILKLFNTDPLTWDVSTLSRIYKLPEDYCKSLVEHVKPFMYYSSNKVDEPVKLVKVAFVFDVAKFKSDKRYMPTYQKLNFTNPNVKLKPLSTEPVLDIADKEERI